jgi:FemAB-related protein (PEP-CTERM system-associated)
MQDLLTPPGVSALEIGTLETPPDDWDDFVRQDPDGRHAHLARWREVMSAALGHECRYLVARNQDDELRGVLPLVRVRSRLFGDHLVSMPFLNDGGPLGDPAARALLVAEAVAQARASAVDDLELRMLRPQELGLAPSRDKVTVHLPLPGSVDELWKSTFRAKLRSQIRRPLKVGMQTRFGPEQREAFYGVFARNMRDLGTPVHSARFFEAIATSFPEHTVFAVVYHEERPVAAGCGFLWRDAFEITWASALREASAHAPNMLLYASLMEHAIERGARLFDFGRCTPGGGTHRFKLQWGGHDVPLPWQRWSGGGSHAEGGPERRVFQLATAVWQRLPVPVANRLGPVIARRIPWF